jgi:hypothetical protein
MESINSKVVKREKMKNFLIGTLGSLLISILLWFVSIVYNPSDFEMILFVGAIVSTATFICLSVVCISRLISRNLSSYAVFAVTDTVLAIAVASYAIYDIKTDTSEFMSGLLGCILLMFVIPTLVLLLVVNLIIWWIKRKKK